MEIWSRNSNQQQKPTERSRKAGLGRTHERQETEEAWNGGDVKWGAGVFHGVPGGRQLHDLATARPRRPALLLPRRAAGTWACNRGYLASASCVSVGLASVLEQNASKWSVIVWAAGFLQHCVHGLCGPANGLNGLGSEQGAQSGRSCLRVH